MHLILHRTEKKQNDKYNDLQRLQKKIQVHGGLSRANKYRFFDKLIAVRGEDLIKTHALHQH